MGTRSAINTIQARWQALGIDVSTLSVNPDATIGPTRTERGLVHAADQPRSGSAVGSVQVGRLIAEGGVGRVHEARQVEMGRQVAVKVPHKALTQAQREAVVLEAQITGALQHPGIVPVYGLSESAEGLPLIVMRRLRGQTWADALTSSRRRASRRSSLEGHLATLERIAEAIAYAHSRGVIHRDLKPENVMVGEFGEVTVLDWGLAAAVDLPSGAIADASGERDVDVLNQLPRAKDISRIEGTLAYMAPEMACGDGTRLGPATDVYLLGGLLHELLSGRPPHHAFLFEDGALRPAAELLLDIYLAEPPALHDAPAGLASLCQRALANAPEERFRDAQAFLHALRTWRSRAEVEEAVRAGQRALDLLPTLADDESRKRVLAEVNFAVTRALSNSPGDTDARALLNDVLVEELQLAIDSGSLGVAESKLASISGASAVCARRAEALRERLHVKREREAALRQAAEDADITRGTKARAWFGAGLGMVWLFANVAIGYLRRGPQIELDAYKYAAVMALASMALLPPIVMARERFLPNLANVRAYSGVIWQLVGQGAVWMGLAYVGVPMHLAFAISLVQFAFATGTRAIDGDIRELLLTLPILLGAMGAALFPFIMYECAGVAYAAYFYLVSRPGFLDAPEASRFQRGTVRAMRRAVTTLQSGDYPAASGPNAS